jgi:hypothetical protein
VIDKLSGYNGWLTDWEKDLLFGIKYHDFENIRVGDPQIAGNISVKVNGDTGKLTLFSKGISIYQSPLWNKAQKVVDDYNAKIENHLQTAIFKIRKTTKLPEAPVTVWVLATLTPTGEIVLKDSEIYDEVEDD